MDLEPIRRYVDADHSCLFSSIAYLMNREEFDESSSYKYRMMIVEYLQNNNCDDSLLGMSQVEYMNQIQELTSWGGQLETKMLSDILNVQIAVIDVQTNKDYIYGKDNKRIYLLYNGVHYDPLVMNFSVDASNESDITIFDSNDSVILNKFKTYCSMFKQMGDFCDLSQLKNFECEECQNQFRSESDALVHAQNTNHWEFKQI